MWRLISMQANFALNSETTDHSSHCHLLVLLHSILMVRQYIGVSNRQATKQSTGPSYWKLCNFVTIGKMEFQSFLTGTLINRQHAHKLDDALITSNYAMILYQREAWSANMVNTYQIIVPCADLQKKTSIIY